MAGTLLDYVTDYLVAQNLVRKPNVAAPGGDPNRPVLWRSPRNGVPAPGEGSGTEVSPALVVGAFRSTGEATQPWESFRELPYVDFRIRAARADLVFPFEDTLRALLHDKRAWDMAGLQVIESLQFRALQFIGSDNQAFDYSTEYRFEVYT